MLFEWMGEKMNEFFQINKQMIFQSWWRKDRQIILLNIISLSIIEQHNKKKKKKDIEPELNKKRWIIIIIWRRNNSIHLRTRINEKQESRDRLRKLFFVFRRDELHTNTSMMIDWVDCLLQLLLWWPFPWLERLQVLQHQYSIYFVDLHDVEDEIFD